MTRATHTCPVPPSHPVRWRMSRATSPDHTVVVVERLFFDARVLADRLLPGEGVILGRIEGDP